MWARFRFCWWATKVTCKTRGRFRNNKDNNWPKKSRANTTRPPPRTSRKPSRSSIASPRKSSKARGSPCSRKSPLPSSSPTRWVKKRRSQVIVADTALLSPFPEYPHNIDHILYLYFYNPTISNLFERYFKPPSIIELMAEAGSSSFAQGVRFAKAHNYSEALKAFTAAIEEQPHKFTSYLNRGSIECCLGLDQFAIEDFNHVIQLEPYEITGYYNRFISHYKIGKKLEAQHDLYVALSLAYMKKGEELRQVGLIGKALDIVENNALGMIKRGNLYKQQGNIEMAINDYTGALDADDKNLVALTLRAPLYKSTGREEEAEEDVQKIAELTTVNEKNSIVLVPKIPKLAPSEIEGDLHAKVKEFTSLRNQIFRKGIEQRVSSEVPVQQNNVRSTNHLETTLAQRTSEGETKEGAQSVGNLPDLIESSQNVNRSHQTESSYVEPQDVLAESAKTEGKQQEIVYDSEGYTVQVTETTEVGQSKQEAVEQTGDNMYGVEPPRQDYLRTEDEENENEVKRSLGVSETVDNVKSSQENEFLDVGVTPDSHPQPQEGNVQQKVEEIVYEPKVEVTKDPKKKSEEEPLVYEKVNQKEENQEQPEKIQEKKEQSQQQSEEKSQQQNQQNQQQEVETEQQQWGQTKKQEKPATDSKPWWDEQGQPTPEKNNTQQAQKVQEHLKPEDSNDGTEPQQEGEKIEYQGEQVQSAKTEDKEGENIQQIESFELINSKASGNGNVNGKEQKGGNDGPLLVDIEEITEDVKAHLKNVDSIEYRLVQEKSKKSQESQEGAIRNQIKQARLVESQFDVPEEENDEEKPISTPTAQKHAGEVIKTEENQVGAEEGETYIQKLEIFVVSAKIDRDTEVIGKMSPYVLILYNGWELKTQVATSAGKVPEWNQKCSFNYDQGISSITFQIYDKETFKNDDLVGQLTLNLKDIQGEQVLKLLYKEQLAAQLKIKLSIRQ